MRASSNYQRGLTIVELMVGLVIGLLLLGGVFQIYLSSNQTYRSTDALSRMQENARFAMDFLQADIREAGYKGACGRGQPLKNHLNTASPDYDATLLDISEGILGWEADDGGLTLANYRPGTDTLLLKHAATLTGVTGSGKPPIQANGKVIGVHGGAEIPSGTILLVSDANGCELFQRTNSGDGSLNKEGNNETPGNTGEEFSRHYGEDLEITVFQSAVYYISQPDDGLSSLRRSTYSGDEELVEGIADLQVCYGIDDDDDASVDDYVEADEVADWGDVISARLTVVAISPQTNVAAGAVTVSVVSCGDDDVDGDGKESRTSADYPELAQGRLAQAFTSTIALRNRLLYE